MSAEHSKNTTAHRQLIERTSQFYIRKRKSLRLCQRNKPSGWSLVSIPDPLPCQTFPILNNLSIRRVSFSMSFLCLMDFPGKSMARIAMCNPLTLRTSSVTSWTFKRFGRDLRLLWNWSILYRSGIVSPLSLRFILN